MAAGNSDISAFLGEGDGGGAADTGVGRMSGIAALMPESGRSRTHPTEPSTAAPANDRFRETVILVPTTGMGAKPPLPMVSYSKGWIPIVLTVVPTNN